MAFPIDMEMIRRTEAKLGRKLPPGYVARMRQNNGGSVETEVESWDLRPIFDDSDRTRLKRTCNDIVRETTMARQLTPDFPASALVIGNNGGGDLLVFLVDSTSDHYGNAVYWWSHETGEVAKVADDFDELQ